MIILAVDLGKARTGIAACDPGEMLASPVTVIEEWNRDKLCEKICTIAKERKALSFTPITSNENEKVLTVPAAVLLPDIEYIPTMGGDHVATLTFAAYPDENGQLFTYC